MNLIRADRQNARRMIGTQRHASLEGLGLQNAEHIPNHIVDVQPLQLGDIGLLQQLAESRNDFYSPLVA